MVYGTRKINLFNSRVSGFPACSC